MKNKFYKNLLFSKNILLGFIFIFFSFPELFAQESTELELNTPDELYHNNVPAQGSNNANNWLNNNNNNTSGREQQTDNANFGMQDNSSTDLNTDQTIDNSSRNRGGVRRLGRSSNTLDGPGGPPGYNPDDVPFDGRLNLIFLIIGLLFASFIVVRKVRLNVAKN